MVSRFLSVASIDGTIDATLHLPPIAGVRPSVILLTDIRGVRPVYETLADRVAAEGYAVLLPNLYYRSRPAPAVEPEVPFDDAAKARLQGYRALLTREALGRDFDAFVTALGDVRQADADRIGVVGYCMSGAFALRLAAAFPDRVRAAASFHGGNLAIADDADSPHLLASGIKARLYIGHADQDATAPPEQIARLAASLAASGVDHVSEFYAGARHGFAIADSAAYDSRASERHLYRLLDLFAQTLS